MPHKHSTQYGIPRLVDWLKSHQQQVHKPPYTALSDWHVLVTTGSADGNAKAFNMLLDEGDYVLVENPTYA